MMTLTVDLRKRRLLTLDLRKKKKKIPQATREEKTRIMYQTQYKNNKIHVRNTVIQERSPFFPSLWSFVVYQTHHTKKQEKSSLLVSKNLRTYISIYLPHFILSAQNFAISTIQYSAIQVHHTSRQNEPTNSTTSSYCSIGSYRK